MNETIPIHGRGNFPTLEVKLVDLVVLGMTVLTLFILFVLSVLSAKQWSTRVINLSKNKFFFL